MNIEITDREWLAARFYMGDPAAAAEGAFRGGPKAYNTINALLHPGTENEEDKAKEGRVICLEDAAHLKSYLQIMVDVFLTMEKYRRLKSGTGQSRTTYRIDRASSLERFLRNEGSVYGFFSTCKYGFLPEYAHAKADIVLLEVERDESVPWLDFEEALGQKYAKPQEAEILLPFGMEICRREQIDISGVEKEQYTDLHGRPPCAKWHLTMTMPEFPVVSDEELRALYEAVTGEAAVNRIRRGMEKLSAGKTLTPEENSFYSIWKEQLRRWLYGAIRHACR